jgi:hypothetical protein
MESVIRPNVRSAGLRIRLALGGGREMLNETNRITYWKLYNGAPGPRTTVEMIDKLMDAARAEGRLDATYAKAKVIYDAVTPFVRANDHGRLHDAIIRITRQADLAGEPATPETPAFAKDAEIAALETSLIRALVFASDATMVLRRVLDMLIGMSHPPVSSQADQRKWSPVMETIAHETDWPSLLAIVHWAWRDELDSNSERALTIGPDLESVEELESVVRIILAKKPPAAAPEERRPQTSDPVHLALIAEARELAAHVGPEGGQGTAQMIRKLANALEDTVPLTDVPRDREMARRLVDAVWGYLEGDVSVPSTRVADKIIDRAVETPEHGGKLIRRVELDDGENVYITMGQGDLIRLIWEGAMIPLDDPRLAALKAIGMLQGTGDVMALTKRGLEVARKLIADRHVIGQMPYVSF